MNPRHSRRGDRVIAADDDRYERSPMGQRVPDRLFDVAVGDVDIGQVPADVAEVPHPQAARCRYPNRASRSCCSEMPSGPLPARQPHRTPKSKRTSMVRRSTRHQSARRNPRAVIQLLTRCSGRSCHGARLVTDGKWRLATGRCCHGR